MRFEKNESAILPANIEAEQAVLGILLYDNPALHLLPPGFGANHFFEPFHKRLFDSIEQAVNAGRLADPAVFASRFASDPAYRDLGGGAYLGDLMDKAPPSQNVTDYGADLMKVALRRDLLRAADDIREAALDDDMDAADALHEAERSVGALSNTDTSVRLVSAEEAVARVFRQLDSPGETAEGVLTGLGPLDEHLGPLMPGDVILLGGRPSMGKSAEASVIGQNVALQNLGVMDVNTEMSVEQMMRRRLTSLAFAQYAAKAPSYSSIRKRAVEYDQRQMLERAAEIIRGLPLVSMKRNGLTISKLRSLARRQFAEWKRAGVRPGLLVVDHAGHFKAEGKSRGRYEDQTEISGAFKELAEELQVPILVLAQLSRKLEERDDKRPTLPDFRDSGSWEQDADIVIGVYRDAYYAQREREPKDGTAQQQLAWADWDRRKRSKMIDNILLKVREGEVGNVQLWGDMRTNAILGEVPGDDLGGFI